MALIKYGGGIVQMSGSIAGSTHARNRFGNYMRARTKPVNPKSDRQEAARTVIRYLAEYWRGAGMDDSKREAWETYANGVAWNNALGESVKLTGFNMFIRANAALLRCGGAIVADGPADIGLPPGDPEFRVVSPSEGSRRASIFFDDTLIWCDEDNAFMIIETGQPQNATRNFFGGPWRYWVSIIGAEADPPSHPYTEVPGTPYTFTLGQKIWFRASIIRKDGRMSTKFYCEPAIVKA